jgi:ATP-binding protein involved in chromosome partitioning
MEAMLRAVRDVPGVGSAHVEPVGRTASEGTTGADAFDRVIAVASAKGGVGKSTVATHLACALAGDRDDAVGLFDADVHGPNVPDLLDVGGPVHSDEDGSPLPVRTGGAAGSVVADSDSGSVSTSASGADPPGELEVMSVGLLESGAPLGWRGAMAHDAVSELFDDTAWRGGDTLVVDLPPGTGDVVLTTLQEVELDGVVVVTTPFHASVSDTRRSVELFRDNGVPVLGTVVNMARYVCDCCGEPNDLFRVDGTEGTDGTDGTGQNREGGSDGGDVGDGPARASGGVGIDAPVLAELPFTAALQRTPTPGSVPEPIGDLAGAVTDRLAVAGEVSVDPTADIRGLEPEARKRRVRAAFEGLDPDDRFVLVSDRDPTPVRRFLARLADADPGAFDPFEVRRATPDDWVLETVRP